MSKSIYEVAIKTLDNMFDSWDRGVHLQSIEFIEETLEQAQKQEKLLELYKKLSKYVSEQVYAHELPEITNLKIKIKELEKWQKKSF